MQIINLFYILAREHKLINGFYFGKSYEKGAANEAHPLVWLDDPIYGQSVGPTLSYTCNVDILGIPETTSDVPGVQSAAFQVGLDFAEKVKQSYPEIGFKVGEFSFTSLRDYYDNNAAGMRFTYSVIQANPVDRCNDNFDPDKHFPNIKSLPDFSVSNPDGCAVFSDKAGLPSFKIKDHNGCAVFYKPEL